MPIAPWNPGGYYPFNYGQIGRPVNPGTNTPSGINPSDPLTRMAAGGVEGGVPTISPVPSSSGPGAFTSFMNSFNPQPTTTATSGSNVTGQAQANNLASAPDLASLTNLINQLNIGAQQQANAARIPGAAGLEQQSSTNIGSLLGGNIPQDVVTQLAQQAAERGVAIGSPGSDNSTSALLRSLGLTSLDLQQLGQQDLTQAYARNPVAKLFDPTTQLITPYQQGELNNQANQLALEWYRTLHPQYGGTGGGRGGSGYQPQQPTQPDMSWFQRALQSAGGLNQPFTGVRPVSAPPPTTYDPNQLFSPTLDTSTIDVSSPIYDTSGAGYNYNPADTGVGYDIAPPPTSFGYDQPIDMGTYDPFNLYGGG